MATVVSAAEACDEIGTATADGGYCSPVTETPIITTTTISPTGAAAAINAIETEIATTAQVPAVAAYEIQTGSSTMTTAGSGGSEAEAEVDAAAYVKETNTVSAKITSNATTTTTKSCDCIKTANIMGTNTSSSAMECSCNVEQLQQQQHPVTTGNAGVYISSPSGTGSSDLLDNMPQWKRDLIQRRKTNIARTIGANQTGATTPPSCPKKDSSPISTSPVMPLTKTSTACNNSGNSLINNGGNSGNTCNTNTTNNNNFKSSSHSHSSSNIVKSPALSHPQQNQSQSQQYHGLSSGHYTMLNSSTSSSSQSQFQQLQTLSASNASQNTQSTAAVAVCNTVKLPRSGIGSISNNHNHQQSSILSPTTTGGSAVAITAVIGGEPVTGNSISKLNSDNTGKTCLATLQEQPLPPTQHIKKPPQVLQQPDSAVAATNNASTPLELQQQQPFQSHSRHDIEKLSLSLSSSCSVGSSVISPTTNNLFIKNPSANKTCKTNNKYKVNSINKTNATIAPATSASLSPLNSFASNTNAAGTAINKKMVAAQDITDNTTNNIDFDFDPSEELQYGPGIVSKLRCRYLSLALRQSANKQRPPLDSLRRATSLNNLLDDDEDSNSSCVVDQVDNQHHHHYHGQKAWNISSSSSPSSSANVVNSSAISAIKQRNPDEFVATFQKNLKLSERDKRSRQIKRGNDSLKRARSVEALLGCDKTWDNENSSTNNNGVSLSSPIKQLYKKIGLQKEFDGGNNINVPNNNSNSNDMSSVSSSAEVTIEDKISNARERILLNNEKPPKRLTSIIDDTERPPPDVVKQTLKIFEATANRRGRGISRNNFSGEVAAKVANYKSIISQEKPPIVFPKPPLSPKKHFRHHGNLDLVKKSGQQTGIMHNNNKKAIPHVTSPISNITKKFANIEMKSSIESNEYHTPPHSQSSSPTISLGHRPVENSAKNECIIAASSDVATTTTSTKNIYEEPSSPGTPDLIPRFPHFDLSINCADSSTPITQLSKKFNSMTISSNTSSPIQHSVHLQKRDSESDDSMDGIAVDDYVDDDDDDYDDLQKRVSKTALDNISKAGTTQHFSFNKNSSKILPLINTMVTTTTTTTNGNSLGASCDQPGEEIAIINAITTSSLKQQQQAAAGVTTRPLLSEPKLQTEKSNSSGDINLSIDEISAKNRDKLVITSISQTKNISSTSSSSSSSNSRTGIPPQIASEKPALTSREIEKNLINEKKNEQANLESGGGGTVKWQLGKKKPWNSQMAPSQNNSMVFNFKDRKEVPDYIENDGIIFKRRRELPKPNEPGFVLLGDLSLETSTDPDDSWTMGPPSPCDVEFENANIIIDGKSSIRYRTKDISLRVQFDDNLTSTFEYPSESSMQDDTIPPTSENSNNKESSDHITVEEIIQIPSPKLLGTVSLGSAPLSSYTPVKAPINTNFELGVTRTLSPQPSSQSSPQQISTATKDANIESNSGMGLNNSNGTASNLFNNDTELSNKDQQMDICGPIQNGNITEFDSLPYLKPATDDLTVVYSEGADKADLLY